MTLKTVTRVISREQVNQIEFADRSEMHNKTLRVMEEGIKSTQQFVVVQKEAAKLYTAGTVLTSLFAVGACVGLLLWGYRIGNAICKTIKK